MPIPDELRDTARRIIRDYGLGSSAHVIEYGQLSTRPADEGFPGVTRERTIMSDLLGAIHDLEVPEGSGPEVASCAALVVHKDDRLPGTGYWVAVDRRRNGRARPAGTPPTQADVEWGHLERARVWDGLGVPIAERPR